MQEKKKPGRPERALCSLGMPETSQCPVPTISVHTDPQTSEPGCGGPGWSSAAVFKRCEAKNFFFFFSVAAVRLRSGTMGYTDDGVL